MSNVAKVACSIDADLLARVESVRKKTGESRSAFVSRALRMLTAESARALAVARYVEVYRERAESPDDVRAARRSSRHALSRLPWQDP
jgi:metal-responsive CopG/Arc/MetJ family transcriptional regulator